MRLSAILLKNRFTIKQIEYFRNARVIQKENAKKKRYMGLASFFDPENFHSKLMEAHALDQTLTDSERAHQLVELNKEVDVDALVKQLNDQEQRSSVEYMLQREKEMVQQIREARLKLILESSGKDLATHQRIYKMDTEPIVYQVVPQ